MLVYSIRAPAWQSPRLIFAFFARTIRYSTVNLLAAMSEPRTVAEVNRLEDLRVHIEEFNIEENQLGSGAYGVVYEVTVDGKKCIAKKLHNILLQAVRLYPQGQDDSIVKKFRQECYIVSQLKHSNVVGFVGVHFGRDRNDISLIMERLDCDLADFVRKNPDTPLCDRLYILYDVSKGLDYLHSQSPPLIHRDLTAPNILLTKTLKAKIGDLGVSRYLDPSDVGLTTNPGNLHYMPPECRIANPRYTTKLDIFSFGNLIIHTIIGDSPRVYDNPPTGLGISQTIRRLQGKTELMRRDNAVHQKMGKAHCLYPLVVRCLHDSPDQRPAVGGVKSFLKDLCTKHPRKLKMTLLEASETGNVEVVEELLEWGANPNQLVDKEGDTALIVASRMGHDGIVRMLLETRADVNMRNNSGATPLLVASFSGHHKCVKLLIEAGANVDVPIQSGATSLYMAAQNDHVKVVEMLVGAKCQVDLQRKDGFSALIMASHKGHYAVVKLLLEAKADVDIKTDVNNTALYYASMNGHNEVVRALLESKATVNTQNKSRQTPLWTASCEGHHKCVELLIQAGANVDVPKEDGATPLMVAAQNGYIQVVEILIGAKCQVDLQTEDGATPLCVGAQNGHEKVVEMLIGAKCQVDLQMKDGWTALHVACEKGHLNIAKRLIVAHANINARAKFNDTPLILAAYHGHSSVVQLLLFRGADPNLKGNDGKTAYDHAHELGHNQVCQNLMSCKSTIV